MADLQLQYGRCLHGSDGVAGKVQSTVGGDSYCQRDSKGTEKVWQGGRYRLENLSTTVAAAPVPRGTGSRKASLPLSTQTFPFSEVLTVRRVLKRSGNSRQHLNHEATFGKVCLGLRDSK